MNEYQIITKRHPIPDKANADIIAEMVHVLLSTKVRVSKLLIEVVNEKPEIVVDFIVKIQEPPFGEPPEIENSNLWEVLLNVPITELQNEDNVISIESIAVISNLLLMANKNSKVGIGWVVGSKENFFNWLGISITPDIFLNLPIIEMEEIPEHNVLLLVAKSSKVRIIDAEECYKASII